MCLLRTQQHLTLGIALAALVLIANTNSAQAQTLLFAPPPLQSQARPPQSEFAPIPNTSDPLHIANAKLPELPPSTAGELPSPQSTPPTPPATEDQAASSAPPAEKTPDAEKPKDKIGEEPPNTAIDVFRQSTVLLPVGITEWDCGFQYSLFEHNFLSILPSSTIVPQNTSSRLFLGTVSWRYGLSDCFQPFVTLPAGISSVETANSLQQETQNEYGVGDVSFGGSYLLRDGHDECADIVFNLTCVAPTGQTNFLSIVPGSTSLGNGFWVISPTLTWTRTFDPVVIYGTIGYLHRFERDHFDIPIRPGEEIDIGYGAGFAINDALTYSLQFQWAHQFDTVVNGVSIDDSGCDVASIRQSAIIRLTPKKFVEVFFANGLTSVSPEVSGGVTLIRRF